MADGPRFVAHMEAMTPVMLADIETLVTCESPSDDLAAVALSAEVVSRVGADRLGADPERIVIDGRTHLRWQFGGSDHRRVLVVGHHDTVWPIGSLATHPFAVDGGILRGPGCLDMKAGLAMAFHAATFLAGLSGLSGLSGLTLLVTGDEELGSPSSRSLIEAAASGCAAALVLEASADGGALKTARKGLSFYELRVRGHAAHAGSEPENGVNSTIELAHQINAISALADPARGTTVTPTKLWAGTTINTIPATGTVCVDVRARTVAEQERVDEGIRVLRPALDGAELEVFGGPNRPPMPAESSASLYARACELATELGLTPPPSAIVGGVSDGNFTAGVGTPTLDGLGAVGGGPHADNEHVVVAELPRRAALLAALLADLLARPALKRQELDSPNNS
jgi:glutamate carboxypeptidase